MKINKKKIKEWWNRYALAELFGLIGTVIFAYLTYKLTGNQILAAYMGAVGENIGYYGVIIFKEFSDKNYTGNFFTKLSKRIRNIMFEFGIPEIFDFFIIRPLFLYFTPQILGNYVVGIIVGKILADVIFYGGTIYLYELGKKIFKK